MIDDVWSSFGELFFVAGILLALAAMFGWKVRPSERTATVLTGLGLSVVTVKYVLSLAPDTGRDLELLGVALVWLSFVIMWWRRKNAGPAA